MFKQESLDARDPNINRQLPDQEKLSLIDGTTFDGSRQVGSFKKQLALRLSGALLSASSLILACAPPSRDIQPTPAIDQAEGQDVPFKAFILIVAEGSTLPLKTETTLSPVEQAIQNGKIEVNNASEAAKVFKPVAQEKAEELIAQGREKGEYAIFPPIKNLDKHSALKIENFTANGTRGEISLIAIDGIQPGDEIVASTAGRARLIAPGNTEATNLYMLEINTGREIVQILFKDPQAEEKMEKGATKEIDVKPGDILLKVVSPQALPSGFMGHEVVVAVREGDTYKTLSLNDFIKINGAFTSLS